ncbi:hypothetical protein EXU85_02890 [Spirosoma sp. KCTC 42546]|uniref:hypothetical protein n=1 Tax=Spirosoma sp. KCTC 42546 TaxID=2520506 RepID=UPI00115A1814|nr:hypothetical protein [Spirosoma sp. KCTC 42546]QDK77596.1 hypothetical protein EXU85_02890 [Spirosoma sp. KCTC 42546]
MITEANNLIPTLTRGDILQYVATHEFNEIGDQEWFRLIPHGENLFRTPEYGFFSGIELTVGDILWIAAGLSNGYQARPYAAEPISVPHLATMN